MVVVMVVVMALKRLPWTQDVQTPMIIEMSGGCCLVAHHRQLPQRQREQNFLVGSGRIKTEFLNIHLDSEYHNLDMR